MSISWPFLVGAAFVRAAAAGSSANEALWFLLTNACCESTCSESPKKEGRKEKKKEKKVGVGGVWFDLTA